MKESAPPATSRRTVFLGFALSILLFAVAYAAVRAQSPPDAAPAGAPPTEFSSARSMRHLRAVAREPHPTGSPAHAEVRDYILRELAAQGLQPDVQKATAVNPNFRGLAVAGTVQNIVARLKGAGAGRAVMLACHYDSVPTGPGASDDGAAVAVLLETLRALRAGPALSNDVIFLFTDGEEAGLLGARAFVDEHPWAKDVGVVLNFEARGVGGPSIMFETSDRNGSLVAEFAEAAPHPLANSLAYEIYRLLPNDTDLSVFKRAGMPGLGFAYIEGLTHYHTQLDSVENADERSIQHHGSYALALARRFGNLGLARGAEPNAVYFNPFGTFFVCYPGAWVVPLTLLATLLFAGVVALGFRRRRLTLSGVALGALAFLASMIAAPLAVALVWRIVRAVHGGYELIPQGDTYNSHLYVLGFAFLAVAVTSAVYLWFGRKVRAESLAVGALLWWLILTVSLNLTLPGGSYLFTWPLLFSLAGLAAAFAAVGEETFGLKSFVILALCALPGVLLFSPLFYQTYVALSLRLSWAVVLLPVLLLGLLVPHLKLMASLAGRWWPGALALLSAGFLVAGSLTSGFDRERRQPSNLFYGLNADTNGAVWGSYYHAPDEWTAQFLSAGGEKDLMREFFPANTREFLKSRAPAAPLAAPEIKVLDDSTSEGVRALRLRVTSARRAPFISIHLESDAEVARVAVNGRELGPGDMPAPAGPQSRWGLRYHAPPEEGFELLLGLKASQPVRLRAVDRSNGHPALPGVAVRPRPDHLMPAPFAHSDATLVSRSFTF